MARQEWSQNSPQKYCVYPNKQYSADKSKLLNKRCKNKIRMIFGKKSPMTLRPAAQPPSKYRTTADGNNRLKSIIPCPFGINPGIEKRCDARLLICRKMRPHKW